MFTSLTARVDKATSELLAGPDWNMNFAICDSTNNNLWLTKDMVKALKKRLKHRNPKIQVLALTLLETMMKNCGDYLHLQISERNILRVLTKIVRKSHNCSEYQQFNAQVRDKILILIETWKEAYGGIDGKRPQYYWAYTQLRRAGVQFPERPADTSPAYTPPVKQLTQGQSQAGSEMSRSNSLNLKESESSDQDKSEEVESLSLSHMDCIRSIKEVLADMLYNFNPNECEPDKREVMLQLVDQCRCNQKKLPQFLNSNGDQDLLTHGLRLNDSLNNLLAKHDAIVSGKVLIRNSIPRQPDNTKTSPKETGIVDTRRKQTEMIDTSPRQTEIIDMSPRQTGVEKVCPAPSDVTELIPISNERETDKNTSKNTQVEEEDDENDHVMLLPRQTRNKSNLTENAPAITGGADSYDLIDILTPEASMVPATVSMSNNPFSSLVLTTSPPPVRTTMKEQDLVDQLSITLSTTTISPQSTLTPLSPSNQNMLQLQLSPSTSPTTNGHPYGSHPYVENQLSYGSYVVPWVQAQFHPQPQTQPQLPNYRSACPPPPWETTAHVNGGQIALAMTTPYTSLMHHSNASPASYMPMQQCAVVPINGNHGPAMYGEEQAMVVMRNPNPTIGQKAFIPSYRLFEDLDVLGSPDRKFYRLNSTVSNQPAL
ncbi:hypothetical protein MKX01_002613 [Papaver californicum]|nr:hypothetical protein MKX01_002613 [Papaver californicum]